MSPLQQFLLAGYYFSGWPLRQMADLRRRRAGRAPVMSVFYHRVADSVPNDWTIDNATFARQVEWMQAHFDLVSLTEAQARIRSGRNARPAVAITFDDGYFDNCQAALPLLLRMNVPVTYFVSTQFVLEEKPFPHDVAAGQPLRPNTLAQLRSLAAAGVEIGAHTRTHADLGKIHDPNLLYDELVASRDELEDAVGAPIRYFAFPYGQPWNMSSAAVELARRAGFSGVCSAYGGYNFPGDDPFHLQRIHGDPTTLRLKNWLTIDPRKLAIRRPTFDRAAAPQEVHG